jgi:tetratricopeptide (TPR) repeat protein
LIYDRFLYLRSDNPLQAEPIFVATLKNDPKCEVALYYLSLLYFKERKNAEKAEHLLNELFKISPQHSNGNITIARILIEKLKAGGSLNEANQLKLVEKIISHYELAMISSKEVQFPFSFILV